MQKRILALLLAALMLLSVLAGCGKKTETDSASDAKTTGAETGADSANALSAKYAYQAEFLELPVQTDYIDSSVVSGNKLFLYASVQEATSTQDENYALRTLKLLIYDLDSRECSEAEYTAPQDENASSGVSGLCAAPDGGVWLLEQNTVYAPVADDSSYEESYANSQTSYRLLRFDADGKLVSETVPDLAAFGEGAYISSMLSDSEGNLYLTDYQIILVLNSEGQPIVTLSDEYSGSGLSQYSADKVGAVNYTSTSDGSSKSVFKAIDVAAKDWGEELPIPNNAWNIYPGSGDYDLYYDYNGNLYGWKAETDENEKVVDWLACDVDTNDLRSYTVLADGRVLGVSSSYDRSTYTNTVELILLTRVDAASLPEKTELTLACMNLDWNLRSQIVKFNRESDKYRIVVKDYSEFNSMSYENAGGATMVTQSGDGLTKLNTEIMSGNIPDLLLTDGLPMRQYAAKGLLEDLYPYIDADMGRDALITQVLDADSEDGKLYELPLSFSIATATGLESVVGGYDSWTLADLEDALGKLNPDATIFNVDATRDNVLSYCLYMNADSFVDWESGAASFDTPEFIDYLNFAARFPAEFDYNTFDWNDYQQDSARMRNKDQLLSMNGDLYGFDSVPQNFAELGGDLCYIGFPSTSGHDGTAFYLTAPIAITTACRDKDAAWSFISAALSDSYQKNQYYFPITKSAFEAAAATAMEKQYETDENGDPVLDENGEPIEISVGGFSYGDGPIIEVYAMTQEQYDTVLRLIDSTHRIMRYDTSLQEIISDETGAFFAGEKSAEETAQLIQNRVQLYLAEQS